jgi:hypothetical protein
MEFESVRPIVSGLIGGVVAVWIGRAWSKWVPTERARKPAAALVRENRVGIFVANALFFAGLIGGVLLYQLGYFPTNDWRALGLGFGFATTSPLIWLYVYSGISGRAAKDVYVAYSISQKTPTMVFYGIIVLGVICFIAAITSLVT